MKWQEKDSPPTKRFACNNQLNNNEHENYTGERRDIIIGKKKESQSHTCQSSRSLASHQHTSVNYHKRQSIESRNQFVCHSRNIIVVIRNETGEHHKQTHTCVQHDYNSWGYEKVILHETHLLHPNPYDLIIVPRCDAREKGTSYDVIRGFVSESVNKTQKENLSSSLPSLNHGRHQMIIIHSDMFLFHFSSPKAWISF